MKCCWKIQEKDLHQLRRVNKKHDVNVDDAAQYAAAERLDCRTDCANQNSATKSQKGNLKAEPCTTKQIRELWPDLTELKCIIHGDPLERAARL